MKPLEFPTREDYKQQHPRTSYRGWMRAKYEWLLAHPPVPDQWVPYYMVLGALNDSTTEMAIAYLQRLLGNEEKNPIYLQAIVELEEEKKEKEVISPET